MRVLQFRTKVWSRVAWMTSNKSYLAVWSEFLKIALTKGSKLKLHRSYTPKTRLLAKTTISQSIKTILQISLNTSSILTFTIQHQPLVNLKSTKSLSEQIEKIQLPRSRVSIILQKWSQNSQIKSILKKIALSSIIENLMKSQGILCVLLSKMKRKSVRKKLLKGTRVRYQNALREMWASQTDFNPLSLRSLRKTKKCLQAVWVIQLKTNQTWHPRSTLIKD